MKKLKIVTIGGGSSYTPELIDGFIKRYDELPVTDFYLLDIEEGERSWRSSASSPSAWWRRRVFR